MVVTHRSRRSAHAAGGGVFWRYFRVLDVFKNRAFHACACRRLKGVCFLRSARVASDEK